MKGLKKGLILFRVQNNDHSPRTTTQTTNQQQQQQQQTEYSFLFCICFFYKQTSPTSPNLVEHSWHYWTLDLPTASCSDSENVLENNLLKRSKMKSTWFSIAVNGVYHTIILKYVRFISRGSDLNPSGSKFTTKKYMCVKKQIGRMVQMAVPLGWFRKSSTPYIIWGFPKMVVPQIINFNRVFHYKPSILGYPYFWIHPNTPSKNSGYLLGIYHPP